MPLIEETARVQGAWGGRAQRAGCHGKRSLQPPVKQREVSDRAASVPGLAEEPHLGRKMLGKHRSKNGHRGSSQLPEGPFPRPWGSEAMWLGTPGPFCVNRNGSPPAE